MILDDVRSQMVSHRRAADGEAIFLQDPYIALDRLHRWYEEFDNKILADQVLAEWVLSEDEAVRFDALSLIDDFKIATTRTALQTLVDRLASSKAPSAPYERGKVHRIIEDLGP